MKKLSFKSFLAEGIAHLEDIKPEDLISNLQDMSSLSISQKVDGSALQVGLESGAFFTSREAKGGERYYSADEYPKSSTYDDFRAAHAALESVVDKLEHCFNMNCLIECEIMVGSQPNALKSDKNEIVFLRITESDTSFTIQELLKVLPAKVTVDAILSTSEDGIEIRQEERKIEFQFNRAKIIPSTSVDIEDLLADLEDYLSSQNQTGTSVLGSPITNLELLSNNSRNLTDERQLVRDEILNTYKIPIKQELLAQLDGKLKGEKEGFVFTNETTGFQFKVVDKDNFTAVNKFNYEVRKNISSRQLTNNLEASLDSRGGLLGTSRIRIAKLFDAEGLDNPRQIKKMLAKFKGSDPKATVINFAKNLKNLDFQPIRKKILAIMISTAEELDESRKNFLENKENYELVLKNGKKVKYSEEVIRRTLLRFAETRKTLLSQIEKIKKTTSITQLVALLFGKQIKEMHTKDYVDDEDLPTIDNELGKDKPKEDKESSEDEEETVEDPEEKDKPKSKKKDKSVKAKDSDKTELIDDTESEEEEK